MNLSTKRKKVVISIVTWNSEGEIAECLNSLNGIPEDWEIWVADNNSHDNTVEIVRRDFPNVHLIENKDNLGFAVGNNAIFDRSDSDYLLLLNPDTVSDPIELQKLLDVIESDEKLGIVGGKLHDGNGNVQVICDHFPTISLNFIEQMGAYRFFSNEWNARNLFGTFFDYNKESSVDWILGAFLIVRREAIKVAGNIPEDYFMFAEAMHWCFLMRQHGFEVLYTPKAEIIHKMNRSGRQLPKMWRVEKSLLCKFVFCYSQYGWLHSRLVQLTDLLAYTFGIWRFKFEKPEPDVSKYWRMNREVVWMALKMDQEQTSRRQLERFDSPSEDSSNGNKVINDRKSVRTEHPA